MHLATAEIDRDYRRHRRSAYAGIFVGYASYYLVRNTLALAIPDILREFPQHSKADLGWALTGLSISYGVSKFLMGSVSDRSNPKYFLPLGLLISCGLMFVMGTVKAIYASLALVIVLQILNGWAQGMGWPPAGKTMVHWFSTKERGLVVSFWNVGHNVGGGLVATFAVAGVALFHDWGAKMYFNAMIAAAIAVVAFVLMRDTPESYGLPPVEDYKNDYPADYDAGRGQKFSYREIFFDHVLTNRNLWLIAIANAFIYFVRYGVVNWIPTYLQTAKGFSFNESSAGWALYEFAAIPGTVACGWVSDTAFAGRRAPATMLFMALTLVAVVAYWLNLHGPLWIDYVALFAIGFLIYGPIMIVGLHALDLVPKQAAGTAAGFTGFFGYVFGSAIAGTGVGWIADHFGWAGVFATMVACCVLTIASTAATMRSSTRSSRPSETSPR
jgi:OPA family glycerol-3-phosphate transporter-like MFS transporter